MARGPIHSVYRTSDAAPTCWAVRTQKIGDSTLHRFSLLLETPLSPHRSTAQVQQVPMAADDASRAPSSRPSRQMRHSASVDAALASLSLSSLSLWRARGRASAISDASEARGASRSAVMAAMSAVRSADDVVAACRALNTVWSSSAAPFTSDVVPAPTARASEVVSALADSAPAPSRAPAAALGPLELGAVPRARRSAWASRARRRLSVRAWPRSAAACRAASASAAPRCCASAAASRRASFTPIASAFAASKPPSCRSSSAQAFVQSSRTASCRPIFRNASALHAVPFLETPRRGSRAQARATTPRGHPFPDLRTDL